MPYIPQELRTEFELALKGLEGKIGLHIKKGELTYLFYRMALRYIAMRGKSYDTISSAIGSLNDTSEELRRRILNPYEDEQREKNGDI